MSCLFWVTHWLWLPITGKTYLTAAKLMTLHIPHSTDRNYFSLYFIIPNQTTKVADKTVRSQGVCAVCYVQIFSIMNHFLKKSVKFNLNFMYQIHRPLHLPDNFECRTTHNLTFKWLCWYLNFSAWLMKNNIKKKDKIMRLWKIHDFPTIHIFCKLHAQNTWQKQEREDFKVCNLLFTIDCKATQTATDICIRMCAMVNQSISACHFYK